MESQELEIKRLQLELQLAQLKVTSNTAKTLKQDESVKTGLARSPLAINAPLKGSLTRRNGRIYSPQVSQNYSMNCPWLNSQPATLSSYSVAQMFLTEKRSSPIFLISWFLRLHTRGKRFMPIIIKSREVLKWALRPGGICSSSLFSCQLLSSRIQPTNHMSALPPDSLQAPLLGRGV